MSTYFISLDAEKMNEFLDADKYIQVCVDGNNVETKADVFSAFEEQLQFPSPCKNKYSRFTDWITDLSWYPPEKGICIMIDHYSTFLKNEPDEKATIMHILCNEVVDFWKKEVLRVVKGGKTREVLVLISD